MNPLFAWMEIGWKTGEMLLASAQVIAHRTSRIAAAGPRPGARDRRELTRMVQEKAEAAAESAVAMSMQIGAINMRFALRGLEQMTQATTALMSLPAGRSPAQALARQRALMRVLRQSLPTPNQISRSTARITRHGLAPIHRRATANAKRLRAR
jgi:hypothetical protein